MHSSTSGGRARTAKFYFGSERLKFAKEIYETSRIQPVLVPSALGLSNRHVSDCLDHIVAP